MRVNKLIELLKTMPQAMEVAIWPVDFVKCDIEDVAEWNGIVYISDVPRKG
ncbi:hypothetical protein [Paenibacillus sp. FSL K6-2859]|uniref:hypothetical protein n=1 Tax=Paenibacillus sp. FSL K6-2859 TaxID=2921482 RepID=UPI0030F541AD